jgi:ABC-type uncharacterized transport system ATPase subunit
LENVVELKNIGKVFQDNGVRALNDVSLELRRGEILALAGENGAGKSTLMRILDGLTMPTEGEIFVRGRRTALGSPLEAQRAGIGMVHQHFMLFPRFTVAENVVMGMEPRRAGIFYDTARAEKNVRQVIDRHGFSVGAGELVGSLTVGEMQQVEILKLLYRDVDIFILDEPTAVLTDREISGIFATFRALAAKGKSIILITHKLDEIKRVSSRVAVMRNGCLVGVRDTEDVSPGEISALMVGRDIDLDSRAPPSKYRSGMPDDILPPPTLEFQNVTVTRRSQARPKLRAVNFAVRPGEILGFAAVGGNGLGTLEAVLGGFIPISSGKILHNGVDITRLATRSLRKNGLAYVPADRLAFGSAGEATIAENMIIGKLLQTRRRHFLRGPFLDKKAIADYAGRNIERYSISGGANLPIGKLSGGNIQKVILAREIDLYRDYIVFSEPTWGLDVASSLYVHTQMTGLRDRGAAVLLLSSNLDEILAWSDRILVFYRGGIAACIPPSRLAPGALDEPANLKEEIGGYMLGG